MVLRSVPCWIPSTDSERARRSSVNLSRSEIVGPRRTVIAASRDGEAGTAGARERPALSSGRRRQRGFLLGAVEVLGHPRQHQRAHQLANGGPTPAASGPRAAGGADLGDRAGAFANAFPDRLVANFVTVTNQQGGASVVVIL